MDPCSDSLRTTPSYYYIPTDTVAPVGTPVVAVGAFPWLQAVLPLGEVRTRTDFQQVVLLQACPFAHQVEVAAFRATYQVEEAAFRATFQVAFLAAFAAGRFLVASFQAVASAAVPFPISSFQVPAALPSPVAATCLPPVMDLRTPCWDYRALLALAGWA